MKADKATVAILTHEFFPMHGGAGVYVHEMARAFAELGLKVEVWAPYSDEIEPDAFPYSLNFLPLKGTQNWSCRLRLLRHLIRHRRQFRGKVLYLPEAGPLACLMYFHPLVFPLLQPREIFITLYGSEILRFSAFLHRRLLFWFLLKSATRIGLVSKYTRGLFFKHFPGPELHSKTILSPGALRSNFYSEIDSVKKRTSSSKIVILTVGRIHPRKGQLAVLEALARLSPSTKESVEYRCVGALVRKKYLNKLTEFAAEHGISLTYLKHIDDERMASVYHDADIFAMTSLPRGYSVEGFGLANLEASHHGLPVVAHRFGGLIESVVDGETGLLADPNDRGELASIFEKLISDQELRHTLGSNGKKFAGQFSWKKNALQLLGIGLDSHEQSKAIRLSKNAVNS